MYRKLSLFAFLLVSICAIAQTASDPVLMVINGKPVTRGEFEYAYNKNNGTDGAIEEVSIEQYVDMYINYRLKVEAALEQHMDTITSFNEEYRTYRDMQLTPALVDTMYIDSIARVIYDNNVKYLAGRDLIMPAHILLHVKQGASDSERNAAKARIDSLYQVLMNGADFSDIAKQYSQDPGSAGNGGQLPWIAPGQLIKEFEDVAYAMQPGEISRPFETSFGYHIVKLTDRKAYESYEQIRGEIIGGLKRQNIEETAAQENIKKQMAATGRSREEIMLATLAELEKTDPSLKYLDQEYHDGLLSYEIYKVEVLDKAENDVQGLASYYKSHKAKYKWEKPHFKGHVFHSKTPAVTKQVKKLIKTSKDNAELRKALKQSVNKDSTIVTVQGPYLCEQGENAYVDEAVFGCPQTRPMKNMPYIAYEGKVLKQPKSYEDVKAEVTADYRDELDKQWVEKLRKKYTFSVDQSVLRTVNNH